MSLICSKMVNFLFSAYFGGHFCYHNNGKSQINTRHLHLSYCSIKQEEFDEKQFLFLALYGAIIKSIFSTKINLAIYICVSSYNA